MSEVVDTKRVGFTFIWKIENFGLVPRLNPQKLIKSHEFTADNLNKTSWYLELEPIGHCATKKHAFIFRLVKSSSSGPNVIYLNYELSVLFHGDLKIKSLTECSRNFHQGATNGKPLFLTPYEIFRKKGTLRREILTVQCKMWYHFDQCLEPGFCLSRIRIGAERKTFTWAIDKFSTLQINEAKSVSVNSEMQWNLSLTMTPFLSLTYDEKIRIKVEGKNEGMHDLVVTLGISVQSINGKSTHHCEHEFKFPLRKIEQLFPLILEKHQLVSNKDLFLPNDVLSLNCVLIVTRFDPPDAIVLNEIEQTTYGIDAATDLEAVINQTIEPSFLMHSSSSSLTNDMKCLLESKHLTDINLKVENEVFPAHKAILAARSSVFKIMFETDMKEKATNTIEIQDFEPDIIRRLLLYIYSDMWDSGISWEIASNVCLAAEKYAIVGLKEACLSFLKNDITINNIYSILGLADMLQDEELKSSSENFIQNNDDVMNSNEWKHFSLEHPQLTIEILTRLYRNVKK